MVRKKVVKASQRRTLKVCSDSFRLQVCFKQHGFIMSCMCEMWLNRRGGKLLVLNVFAPDFFNVQFTTVTLRHYCRAIMRISLTEGYLAYRMCGIIRGQPLPRWQLSIHAHLVWCDHILLYCTYRSIMGVRISFQPTHHDGPAQQQLNCNWIK